MALWNYFRNFAYCRAMNTSPAVPTFEVVTMPIGNGWRVRISDGRHLQFVSGFDAKSHAEEWVRCSAHAWLDKLKTISERL
jgi:hypothetical protein